MSLLLRCIIRQPLDAQDRAVQRLRDGSDDAYPRDAFATLVQRATAFAGWRIACCLRGEQEEDDSASHHQSTSSAPFTKSALPRAAPSVAETTTQGKKKNRGVPRSDLRSDHYSADWRLRTAARFLSLLYAANDEGAVQRGATTAAREPLSIATFYVTLADTLPVVNDYQIWEQNRNTSNKGAFTLCRYPFLLSLGSKTRILAFDAESQMEAQARQAFYNSLYAGKLTNQHPEQQAQLRIQVRRSALVADSLRELSAANTQLKKALRVEFVGEEGLDAGGPRREWLLLLTRALFTPAYGMFRYDDDAPGGVGYFNPASQENAESFALLGSVIGLALYHQIVLDPPLPSALFKLLLHRPVGLRDLAEVRPALARGLQQLLDWDEERDGGSVEDVFARDWVGSYDSFGTEVREPLVPGGDMLSVSASNREDYVARLVQWVLVDSVHTQLDAFREGFVRVLGGPTVTLFAPEELELLTRGSAEPLDLRELRGVTRYEGTTDSDQLIEAFWSYWDALPVDAQRALLAFATGTDRVPATGIATVIFRLHAATPDDSDLLPWSSTCTSTLFLPRYADEAKMRSKLAQAVSLSRGFGLR